MPEIFDVMRSRRSIRKLKLQSVPKQLVFDVLGAAGWAPSAHNAQPYRFLILEDAKIKQELAEAMAKAWAADLSSDGLKIDEDKRRERVDRFAKAPVLILACITSVEGLPKYPDERRQKSVRDLAVQSLGAAIENLLLASHAAGLGACWYAAPCFCQETVRQTLKIPLDVEPQAFVALGYAAEKPESPAKKQISEYCFVDVWGKKLRI